MMFYIWKIRTVYLGRSWSLLSQPSKTGQSPFLPIWPLQSSPLRKLPIFSSGIRPSQLPNGNQELRFWGEWTGFAISRFQESLMCCIFKFCFCLLVLQSFLECPWARQAAHLQPKSASFQDLRIVAQSKGNKAELMFCHKALGGNAGRKHTSIKARAFPCVPVKVWRSIRAGKHLHCSAVGVYAKQWSYSGNQ